MSHLNNLQSAQSLEDLARLLGYKPNRMRYILYGTPSAMKYTTFGIPKRDGSQREISAPNAKLKHLQRRLANLLYGVVTEIEGLNGPTPRRALAHGFAKKQSIVTNAQVHRGSRYVLNLDLKDFFPSINFGRVRGILIKDRRFALHPDVATVIAQIACHGDVLPQGGPCSPVISNIVAHLLDIKLVRLAKKHKCKYSRYADDITFSTNAKAFPVELAAPQKSPEGTWSVGGELRATISKAGYTINEAKTRVQYRGSRQLTTGLLVNTKVNIRPEYYRQVRAMCSSLFKTGKYHRTVPASLRGGRSGDPDVVEELSDLAPLEGMLAHIHYVRDKVDNRDSADKKKHATATRRLYRRFLFFRHFVATDVPVIVPEGITDPMYVTTAIERIAKFHPRLGEVKKGVFRLAFRFLNYSSTVREVLQLSGGTGDLKHFILNYSETLKTFTDRPMKAPVIVLVDNDEGSKEIFGTICTNKSLGSHAINFKSSDAFFRLTDNLYLVKTPELGPTGESCIEDLFPDDVLNTVVDGKTFDPKMKHALPGKYGKIVFAKRVVRAQKGTIDFSGFEPLLDRIVAVLDDFAANPTISRP